MQTSQIHPNYQHLLTILLDDLPNAQFHLHIMRSRSRPAIFHAQLSKNPAKNPETLHLNPLLRGYCIPQFGQLIAIPSEEGAAYSRSYL